MVRSMTGYGRHSEIIEDKEILVEIKSVNHRFFECNIKTPKFYGFLDAHIKKMLKNNINRGKVDVSIYINSVIGECVEVRANTDVALAYKVALSHISEKLSIANDVKMSTFALFNDIFTVTKDVPSEYSIVNDVLTVAQKSLDKFLDMKNIEGANIELDILNILKNINYNLNTIIDSKDKIVKNYEEKLFRKMQAIMKNTDTNENRILLEVGIFSEKVNIDEEIARLKSHMEQFNDILNEKGVEGKKLDFLAQEINREINTIGSKMSYSDVIKSVIDMKNEIEKIREQVQNME